jgi:hypothetical protein
MDDTALKELIDKAAADTRRHFDVVAEGLRRDFQLVADGVLSNGERLDRLALQMKEEFNEVGAMIRLSYAELDRRLRTLEDIVSHLQTRMDRIEATPSH